MSGSEVTKDWAEAQQTKQEPKLKLQDTINKAKIDWKISKEELENIIKEFENEKDQITEETQKNLIKLYKEVWEWFLKNWVTINEWNLDFINKLLVGLEKNPINLENIQKEMKDLKNFVVKSSSKWENYLTLYKSEKWGDRIWYIDLTKWEFEVNRNWFWWDTNKWQNNEFVVDSKREVKVEKKQIPKVEEPKSIESKTEAPKVDNININEDSLKAKWMTSYTKKHYREHFENINKLDFLKVPNKDDLKKLLAEPSRENVKKIQELVWIKGKWIDGKFWPKTMESLRKYIEAQSVSAWAKAKAGEAPKVDTKTAGVTGEWKPEVKTDDKKDVAEKTPVQTAEAPKVLEPTKVEAKVVDEAPKWDKKPSEAPKS